MKNTGLKGEGQFPLSFDRRLTEHYRHVAGDSKVQVGWNGKYQMWNLLWKGRYIMSMNAKNSANDNRVRLHFKKLRSNGYDNVKAEAKKQQDAEIAHGKYLEKQQEEEAREIGIDILVKQKESVFVNGG